MMRKTEETVEAVPLQRILNPNQNPNLNPNQNSNSYSNFTVDPIFGCFCTARTWTLVLTSIKLVSGVFWFGSSVLQRLFSRDDSYGGSSSVPLYIMDLYEVVEFAEQVTFWLAPPFLILFAVALFGIVKERLVLIRFYIFFLCLAKVIDLVLLVYIHFTFETPISLFLFTLFLTLLFNVVPIVCAVAFEKRVAFRKSRHLESTSTTFCAA